MRAGMRNVAERYARGKNTLRRPNFLDPVFELPASDLYPARELARLIGWRQSMRYALIQASANHALEIARRSMQRRLGYVEPARRRGERTAFRDRGQRADVRIRDLVLHRFRRLPTPKRCADNRITQRRLNVGE